MTSLLAYDASNLTLYVDISQVFDVWFVPFYRAPVNLVTVLKLTRLPNSSKYYIASQNDLYQTNELVRFVAPWGIGVTAILIWHFVATLFCVLLAWLGTPVTWAEQRYADRAQSSQSMEMSEPKGITNGARVDEGQVKRLMGFGSEGVSPAKGQTTVATTEQYGNLKVVI